MPLYRNQVAQELESKRSEFTGKSFNQEAVEEFQSATEALISDYSVEEMALVNH